ncbi:MAG: tripeptide aminopeptidase PepT [Treponema sp.]|nr:tripeptide aminopeptidase PepT [Treponema sp.]
MKYLKKDSAWEKELLARFIDYAKTFSTSSSAAADKGKQPSTECQRDFANKIAAELKSLGFEGVQVTKYGYVYAYIPANPAGGAGTFDGAKRAAKPFCLLAHLDTVEECSGKNVRPQVKKRDGETIVTSDGTTLLGGDDKAGLAAIVTALHYLIKNKNIPHPKIEICFSPDEETGHGMDNVPLDLIKSKFAYTVDGGHIGELECECFNAYKSEVVFTGKAAHTGDARAAKMVNAISAASLFVQSLPKTEAPETTDGYDGFFAPFEISGGMEKARVALLLRDFDSDGMERRKKLVKKLADSAAASYGASVKVKHTQQYLNMKKGIEKASFVKERLVQAYKESGVEPVFKPIRGGTDGSRLTEMGIPCPNIFTGAHQFHSEREWVSLGQMLCAADIIVNLGVIYA